jgi:N,N'-diacetylbacillosaminyl-diphospho-undecaprenol alpha-1,3-N-acetylgalactosaminyltransferase
MKRYNTKRACRVIHVTHHPIGAKSFLEPVIIDQLERGLESAIWIDCDKSLQPLCDHFNVKWRQVRCKTSISPQKNILGLITCLREIRRIRPTVIHSHQTRASLWPLLAGRLLRVPKLIYHNHGLSYPAFSGPKKSFLKQYQVVLTKLAHHTFFVSNSNLVQARKDGIISESMGAVPGPGSIAGIDLKRFAPIDRKLDLSEIDSGLTGGGNASCVFCYVGRPSASKGFDTLIEAWKRAKLWRRGCTLLCVGCSNDDLTKSGIRNENRAAGLGYRTDILRIYGASDVVILPSRSEGFPYSLLEASALGLPVVATSAPGNIDAVRHNQTGILVGIDKIDELANAMQLLSAEPGQRQRLGVSGRKWIVNNFNRPIVLEALWHAYLSHRIVC